MVCGMMYVHNPAGPLPECSSGKGRVFSPRRREWPSRSLFEVFGEKKARRGKMKTKKRSIEREIPLHSDVRRPREEVTKRTRWAQINFWKSGVLGSIPSLPVASSGAGLFYKPENKKETTCGKGQAFVFDTIQMEGSHTALTCALPIHSIGHTCFPSIYFTRLWHLRRCHCS
jgi:hypothetical protein